MAKDPAFLFYSDNFLSGTMFFSDEQVGKYIRLLCAQHLTGHIQEKDMLKICKTYDEDVFLKFNKDEAGKFFNERLEVEIERRRKYSESRSSNRKSTGKEEEQPEQAPIISSSYEKHMETGNENEIVTELETGKEDRWRPKSLEDVIEYFKDQNIFNPVPNAEKFYNHYEATGWMRGKNKIKKWKACVKTWDLPKTQPKKEEVKNDW